MGWRKESIIYVVILWRIIYDYCANHIESSVLSKDLTLIEIMRKRCA